MDPAEPTPQTDALSLEAAEEAARVADLEACLKNLEKIQRVFIRTVPTEQLAQAKGRRCILRINDLKYTNSKAIYFEVDERGVHVVSPYESYNTIIDAPLASVMRVVNGVLDGDPTAFTAEWARGKIRVIGQRSVHDSVQFGDVFRSLARTIRRYKEAAR